jgi:hypothetical protein
VVGAGGGNVTRVAAPDGDDRIPASDAASPLRLRAYDANGASLGETGATLVGSTESPAAEGAFVGPVPASAASVELVPDGVVLDTAKRSAAPRVALLAPQRGAPAGKRLAVRWRVSDADGGTRHANVAYSPDGRTWRTVFDGPDRGHATLPGDALARSARGRLRVTIDDGFAEGSVLSPAFTATGGHAGLQIVSAGPATAGERTLLVGQAFDDRLRRLRSPTWCAGWAGASG